MSKVISDGSDTALPVRTATRRAIIIHHDAAKREQLGKGLGDSGWEIFVAEGRKDGLPLMYSVRPDLIFLEIVQDQSDGWETFSNIRLFTDCPLILLADELPVHTSQPPLKCNALVLLGQVAVPDVVAIGQLLFQLWWQLGAEQLVARSTATERRSFGLQ